MTTFPEPFKPSYFAHTGRKALSDLPIHLLLMPIGHFAHLYHSFQQYLQFDCGVSCFSFDSVKKTPSPRMIICSLPSIFASPKVCVLVIFLLPQAFWFSDKDTAVCVNLAHIPLVRSKWEKGGSIFPPVSNAQLGFGLANSQAIYQSSKNNFILKLWPVLFRRMW